LNGGKMKKFLIFILGIFMFSSLVSHSAEVYETASEDFMNAVKTLVISEAKSSKNLKAYIEKGVEEKNLIFSVKIEKEKMIVKDKTGKLLYEKVLSKNVSNSFLPYDKNGKLLTKQEDIGNKTIVTNYLDEGHKLKIIYNFDSNLTTGNIETWIDKTLLSKGKMKDGLPHGEMKVFNEKGKVISIINYKNGIQDGVTKDFNEKGKLIKETLYKNGVEVKR